MIFFGNVRGTRRQSGIWMVTSERSSHTECLLVKFGMLAWAFWQDWKKHYYLHVSWARQRKHETYSLQSADCLEMSHILGGKWQKMKHVPYCRHGVKVKCLKWALDSLVCMTAWPVKFWGHADWQICSASVPRSPGPVGAKIHLHATESRM